MLKSAAQLPLRYLQRDINPIVCNLFGKFAAGVVDTGGNLPPVSLTLAAILPPVSLTPVANLPPESTTLVKLVAKFAAGGKSLTPVANNGINIRLQIP